MKSITLPVRKLTMSETKEEVAVLADAILALFIPGSMITVAVRQQNDPNGTMDFLMSNDDIDEVIKLLERSKGRPEI